jgi:CheY-like chemotaxis protein
LEVALGGVAGIDVIKTLGPFSVVISDMRMPQMDGAHFLSRVREISPDAVRMALTGQTDIETAMAAVNEGRIFRFLTKPISKEKLLSAIEAGIAQHRLITAERDLLEGTLRGCVSVLSEMLSFSNPAAFGRAMRLVRFVRHAAQKLKLTSYWSFEIAAMLSQLGCVTLKQDLVNAAYAGKILSPDDQKKYDGHSVIAFQMLSRIPRMQAIAQMIANQNSSRIDLQAATIEEKREIELGIQLLRTGLTFESIVTAGVSPQEAYSKTCAKLKQVDPSILSALSDLHLELPTQVRECRIGDLAVGMVLHEDLYGDNGILIAGKGFELPYAWIERLRSYAQRGTIPSKLWVQMPVNDFEINVSSHGSEECYR